MARSATGFRPRFAETQPVFPALLPLGERLAQKGYLSRAAIPAILKAQSHWGCRFGEAALALGKITPFELAEALADEHGTSFVDLLIDPPDAALSNPNEIDLYIRHRFIPWRIQDETVIVACADPSRELRGLLQRRFGPRTALVVASPPDIRAATGHLFRGQLSHDASFRLDERAPEYSARVVVTRRQQIVLAAIAAMIAAGGIADHALTATILLMLLGLCYVANIALRLTLFAASGCEAGYRVSEEDLAALRDDALPVYTILAPMYDEANMVPQLVAAIKQIDYPAAALDVKIVLEEEDAKTIEAAQKLELDSRFEILVVPKASLRTKPRACNYALRFARGEHLVIYDAEDRPEPDQLKKAVAAFRAQPPDVACLQARLNVYNVDAPLTASFAVEYAGWFDFMLPGLARLGIPIPLGGTSNHFRTRQLRAVHGWDAFNVTEDADLGVRLARQGLRVVPLDSTTFEEATTTVQDWLGQRSRWLKGYMHTALVHLRHPVEFAFATGFWRFLGFVLFVGGAVATALLAPLAWMLFAAFRFSGSEWLLSPYGEVVSATSFIVGNAILVVLGLIAPLKRRWWKLIPVGLLAPLYWLLISIASYRAAVELYREPHRWNKTRHGFADGIIPRRRVPQPLLLARVGGATAVGILLLLFLAFSAHANPWLKEVGDGEFISSTTVTRQQAGLTSGASANAFSDLHLEYGAHERATLVVDTGLQQYAVGGQAQTIFDTAWLGARVPLRRWDNSLVSIEAVGGISGIRDNPLPGAPLSLDGTGEARLMFGEGFEILDRHAFAGVEAGWRWRGGPPSDELVLDTVAGIAPWQSALLMLQSFAIAATGDARGAYQRYDLLKLQLTLAQRVTEHWWVQAGAISTVAGADSGETGGLLALWRRF